MNPALATPRPLVELVVLLLLAFGVLASVPDLTPLLHYATGANFGPPDFAVRDPLYPLLRGLIAATVVAYGARLLLRRPTEAGDGEAASPDRWLAVLAWVLIVCATVAPVARDVFDRAVVDQAPGNAARYISRTHDGGVLQTEAAMDALLAGRNPYAVDYGDTAMARARDSDPRGWNSLGYERNPALGHIPYLPGAFLASLPLERFSTVLSGGYDQRLFYVLCALAFVALMGCLVRAGFERRVVWLVTGLSPLLLPFYRIGRNDVVLLMLFALGVLLWCRRRPRSAGLALGWACATKPFAWALLPFLAIWAWRAPAAERSARRTTLGATLVTALVLCLPFFIWSPGDFLEDTVAFPLGLTDDAYPLRPDSLGLAALVVGLGWADTLRQGFPMWTFQLAITAPVGLLLARRVWRRPCLGQAFRAAALFLLVGLFCSSFFALNYWAHPAYLGLLALLLLRRPTVRSE